MFRFCNGLLTKSLGDHLSMKLLIMLGSETAFAKAAMFDAIIPNNWDSVEE